MSTTTQLAPTALGDETWGDLFYRAYRQARLRWGRGMILDNLAAEVSRLKPVTDSTIIRYATPDRGEPTNAESRLNIFLILHGMGYDPADFGFTPDNTPGAEVYVRSGMLDQLHPANWVHRYGDSPDEDPEPVVAKPAKRSGRATAGRARKAMTRSTCNSAPAGQKPGTTGPGRKSDSLKAA